MPHQFVNATMLRKLWLTGGWVLVLAIVYLSLTPRAIDIPVDQGDKLGHALAYGALMLWFAQAYVERRLRIVLAIACVALGVGLEFGQLLTQTRTFSISDMLADGVGVLVGWSAAPPRTLNMLNALQAALPRRHA